MTRRVPPPTVISRIETVLLVITSLGGFARHPVGLLFIWGIIKACGY